MPYSTAYFPQSVRAMLAAMLDVVLVAPQIAMNTGNIIRLSANVGARLHLVDPLGFSLDSAAVRRGGLDYHELAVVKRWPSWSECRAGLGVEPERRWFATTAAGGQRAEVERVPLRYDQCTFRRDDVVVFGCESRGLPAEILAEFGAEQRLTIPMRPGNRSLNVANAVAVLTYEAWRQHGFTGAGVDTGDPGGAGTFCESPTIAKRGS
jgi:tRNA (cytidine/uridine-2'-O-)-methyltransferase